MSTLCTMVASQKTLCGELVSGKKNSGRPQLQFKDVMKRDIKAGLNKIRECTPCQYSTLKGVDSPSVISYKRKGDKDS